MAPDTALAVACVLIAALIALPLVQVLHRRRASRESSAVALRLSELAAAVRAAPGTHRPDEDLLARLRRLAIRETIPFEFAQRFAATDPALLADTAQRLALRIKRRVAFERKMLARTAPGRRRGALAAAAPAATLLGLRLANMMLPLPAMALLIAAEAFGCWLLWRVARVEV
jgi:hypothetical protein